MQYLLAKPQIAVCEFPRPLPVLQFPQAPMSDLMDLEDMSYEEDSLSLMNLLSTETFEESVKTNGMIRFYRPTTTEQLTKDWKVDNSDCDGTVNFMSHGQKTCRGHETEKFWWHAPLNPKKSKCTATLTSPYKKYIVNITVLPKA